MSMQLQYILSFMPFIFGLTVFLNGLTKLWNKEEGWWMNVVLGMVAILASVSVNFFLS